MSWSRDFESADKRVLVQTFSDDPSIPPAVVAAIAAAIAPFGKGEFPITVSTFGHLNPDGTGSCSIKVQIVDG